MVVRHDSTTVPPCVVYAAVNLVNGKMYVGATEKTLHVRKRKHLANAARGQSGKFYTAVRKHGPEKFKFVVLRGCKDFWESLEAERQYIEFLRPAYNLTEGGGGVKGMKFSAEARRKMSDAKKGKPSQKRGIALTPEQKEKTAAGMRRWWAEANKIPGGFKRNNYQATDLQRKVARENIARAIASMQKEVICLTDGRRFASLSSAAKHYGLRTGQITHYCRGTFKSKRGLSFSYAEPVQ